MIFKVGDVYRNKKSNISCFIKAMKGQDYVVTWCFKSIRSAKDWGRPIQTWEEILEGPDGYMEYSVIKEHKDLLQEINRGYLDTVEYKDDNKVIINWIPQHSFLAHQ